MASAVKDPSPRISLVTTHWAEKTSRKGAEYAQDIKREEMFKVKLWQDFISTGASTFRLEPAPKSDLFDDNSIDPKDAGRILHHALFDPVMVHKGEIKRRVGFTDDKKKAAENLHFITGSISEPSGGNRSAATPCLLEDMDFKRLGSIVIMCVLVFSVIGVCSDCE
jgi:hypothetical protein